ncbi:Mg2+ transporter protein CorA-like/Zinc transport protein ZntB [Penicillium malachiteum]|uniref:Mg2+ transporter protein CorA-like/Zinc transport protein ZntB n=1 Tax=Penicillium malachiteum TaxID=1324776 RepID=A0AAD6HUE1_9EURO|nr:Mg2+ transporter protein CorA-like/Zinc transport protein ZntB [Penicillium malachiteum]
MRLTFLDKHDFDSSTGSSCSPGNKLSYWGQKIKDQIIDGDGKALESTLMGHAETIEERFSYRFKDNDYDTKALTFLILAAGLGRYAMVRMLLASGADENAITSSGGSPASFLAAEMGYLEILKVFFHSQRALVMETKNKWKQTALMRAASFGRLSIIEFLLENLANTAARDEDGSSAFLMACMNGHLGVVERFMELRPEVVDEKDDNGRNGLLCAAVDGKLSVVEYLMKKPAMIETKDLKGDSAFTLACMAGHLNVVERLMELRPEVAEEKNDSGRNGLLCAAIDGNVSIVEYLMKTPAMMKPRDESGDSAFTLACYFGHLPVVKELIANTPEVLKEADNDGRTGLLCAAWNDKLEIVQYLINDKDAKFDDQDESGFTVLHLASHRGNVGMVKSILQKSTSLLEITSVYGQTPLLSAAEESKPAVAQILLQNGADIKHQNNQKDTALHIASRDGSTELARALIESSKDPLEIRNASHQTPLLTAVTNKHYDIVDILLGAGANINAQDDNGRTALSFAAEHGNQSLVKTLVGEKKAILDIQDNSTKTALLLAVENGSPEIVSFLLQAAENKQRDAVNLLLKSGADLWTKDEDAWTVFHYAARSGDLEIVQELLTQNPSFSKEQNNLGQTGLVIAANNLQSSVVDFLFNHENENHSEDEGFAVLTYAITEGHLDLTKSILQRFSRLASRKNESGDVPLFTAIKSKELDVIEYILTVNVDLGIKDGRGSNLLHCATKNGLLDTMKFLLTQKPDLINERDSDSGGRTPLTIAIWKNEDSLISLLLQNKANVNVQDDSGDTALHSACRFSSPEIVQKLIEAGAEPTTTGEYDSTPLHHAARSGNLQKVDMILEWLSDNSKGRWTVAEDTVGDTPLNDAIIFEQFSIAFKLLGSHSYFPKHPSDDKIYISSQREREKVANWLIAWAIDSTSDQIREHVSVVAYWAILNDQQELLSAILKKGKLPRLDSQDGSTWAHIAALGNNYGALETHSDWPLCLLDRTKKRITPLYLAAKRGNLSLLHRLLNSIDQVDSARALEAIIHETEEKETLLSITAAEEGPGEKSSSLNMLWDNLCSEKMRPAMKNTLKSFNANTDRLMEQAARRYIRGASDSKPLEYLLSLVQDIHGKPNSNGSQETKHSSTTGEWTILQLVVYYQFPLALWCLLSSRRYNREIHIMECNAVNGKWSKHKKELTDIIGDILVTPPPRKPLDTQLLPKNLEEFCKRDRLGTLSTQQGSILDLFTTENHKIAYQHKQAYLKNIIYDEGPDEIMRKEGFKDFRALRDRIHSSEKPAQRSDEGQKPKEKVKPDLKSQPAPADGDGALKNVTSNAETEKKAPHNLKDKIPSSEGDSKEGLSSRPLKKYRWIHLPVNDVSHLPLN